MATPAGPEPLVVCGVHGLQERVRHSQKEVLLSRMLIRHGPYPFQVDLALAPDRGLKEKSHAT